MIWSVRGREWPFSRSQNLGLKCWKLGTRFGQSTGCWCGLCYNCVLNCGFGYCEAGNGHGFRFQGSGTDVNEGVVHGQPTHCFWDC